MLDYKIMATCQGSSWVVIDELTYFVTHTEWKPLAVWAIKI